MKRVSGTLVLLLAMAQVGTLTAGEGDTPRPGPKGPLETRVYNISGLLWQPQSRPATQIRDVQRSGLNEFHPIIYSDALAPANIVELIRSSREAEWAVEGVSIGEWGQRLSITHTAEMHAFISQLLTTLAEQRQKQMSIQVRSITLAELPTAPSFDDKEFAELCAKGKVVLQNRLVTFSGIATHTQGGRMQTYVNDYDAVNDTLDPITSKELNGWVIEVRPALDELTGRALLEFIYLHQKNLEIASEPIVQRSGGRPQKTDDGKVTPAKAPDERNVILDRMRVDRDCIQTSVAAPLGRWVLAGVTGNHSGANPETQVLVFVRADVVPQTPVRR